VFDRQEDACQTEVDDALPILDLLIHDEHAVPAAGVGNGDVEAAEPFDCQADQRLLVGLRSDVAAHCQAVIEAGEAGVIDVAGNDLATFTDKAFHDRPADAGRRPGHNRNLVRQTIRHMDSYDVERICACAPEN
jgi:hypothetical protein